MHAIAKMVRVLQDKTERPIEAILGDPIVEVLNGEKVIVRLWHGTCLEAEAHITVSEDRALVRLVSKKELRKDAPPEATC